MNDILPDVLGPGLALVICGSAAGTASARAGAYYAGPGNRFWWILAHSGLTERQPFLQNSDDDTTNDIDNHDDDTCNRIAFDELSGTIH